MDFVPVVSELGKGMNRVKKNSPIIIVILIFFFLFCHSCGSGNSGNGSAKNGGESGAENGGDNRDDTNDDTTNDDTGDENNGDGIEVPNDGDSDDSSDTAPPDPTDAAIELTNGEIVPLSLNRGETKTFRLSVPADATALFAELSDMAGDLDLYTQFGELPSPENYDCRPYLASGSNEICYYDDPSPAQVLYIFVNAYTTGSAALKAVYQTGEIDNGIDFGKLPADAIPWSSWFWPWTDGNNPNLYDDDEALYRYDQYTQSSDAQGWEYDFHGPPQEPYLWYGSCHAWAGAACWEPQPTQTRSLDGIHFRIRDQKGLITAAYYECGKAINHEINASQPSPGLFWKLLQDEIQGTNPMHGQAYPLIGELSYGEEIWNHPIYRYEVNFSLIDNMADGAIKIWYTSDALPSYANGTDLYYHTTTYQFTGVEIIGASPADSGEWIVPDDQELIPYHRPDIIWRPYRPGSWTAYAANPHLDDFHLTNILN
jgi:hypothetical protein